MATQDLEENGAESTTMGSGWTPKPPSGAQADGGVTYGHQRIFVKRIWGRFQRYRWLTFAFFLALFSILPWLSYHGRRAVIFDIPERKFYIFNIVIWPQEFYLLTAMLLLGALGLFFLTTLVGRLWCGYMCPQTVVTNLFLTVERWIEGDRAQQMALAQAPLSVGKAGKFVSKHALWLVMGAYFGFTFISYFVPQAELWHGIRTFDLNAATIAFLFVTGFTIFDGGLFREQMCLVPCPYGRFQGAMVDKHSLMVAYDSTRGEPRGKPGSGHGDCVNCQLCVQVCPTGIDIRNGLQYECITCASCIDACDQVMTKLKRPTGLIRYTSEAAVENLPPRKFGGRPLLYGSFLTIIGATVLVYLVVRPELALDVIRDRSALYLMMPNGNISNLYTLKVMNKTEGKHRYRVRLNGIDGHMVPDNLILEVPSGQVLNQTVSIAVPKDTPAGSKKFTFQLEVLDGSDKPVQTKSTFFVPFLDGDHETHGGEAHANENHRSH